MPNLLQAEKPIFKTIIVGTDWFQVTTTQGNAFYWHRPTKASTWTVPNELRSAFTVPQESSILGSPDKPLELTLKAEDDENDEGEIRASNRSDCLDQLEENPQDEDGEQEYPNIPIEERTELFKRLLGEKNVNPFHSFDVSLQYVYDPRYHLLSDAARREVFDEYCRNRARELRHGSSSESSQPIVEFEQLLKEQVTTPTVSWTAFRKEWKRDRRFYGWGRDDREREKRFRDHLKELRGENAQRTDRKTRAVREREQKVKAEQQKVKEDVERHRLGASLQDAELTFMTLLTDAVRQPQARWEHVMPQVKEDSRFKTSPLPPSLRMRLFNDHIAYLLRREKDGLRALFEANALSLDVPFSALPLQMILSSSPVVKLRLDVDSLEDEFQSWQRGRFVVARRAFDDMLSENSFVDFWGRLQKLAACDNQLTLENSDIGEIEDEKVDMKALAKGIDIRDMENVLKNDKRYIIFDHIPEKREQWLRNYVSNLTESKRSVHISG